MLRKLPYVYLLVLPLLFIFFGTCSNQAVLVANWGKFPVMVNKLQLEEMQQPLKEIDISSLFAPDGSIHSFSILNTRVLTNRRNLRGTQFLDDVHSIMGHNSRLKFLADYINLGDAIYSPGDMFIYLGEWLFGYTAIMWLGLALRRLMLPTF